MIIKLIFIIVSVFIIFYFYTKMRTRRTIYEDANGSMILISASGAEQSRINISTNDAEHWYNKAIIKEIDKKTGKKNVLMLGVALGGMIIHLLHKNPDMYITGVDIIDDSFSFIKKHCDNSRLRLIKADAETYPLDMSYDVIICDIFNDTDDAIPPFVLSDPFISKISNHLAVNGIFIINTIGIDRNIVKSSFVNSFKKPIKNIVMEDNKDEDTLDTLEYNLITIINV